jgi:hypothetical protein
LTDDITDDLTTGLAETITNPAAGFPTTDRYWLSVFGISGASGSIIGFTNANGAFPNRQGDSVLASSDAGVGTTNTKFWRPANSVNNAYCAAIYDGVGFATQVAAGPDNLQQHFPQDAPTVAAGYAVMLALQLLRDNASSRTITCRIKSTAKSADWLYSNAPTKELIRDTMQSWPVASAQMGPVTLSAVPNTVGFYWPFRNSRLRIHSWSLLRAA